MSVKKIGKAIFRNAFWRIEGEEILHPTTRKLNDLYLMKSGTQDQEECQQVNKKSSVKPIPLSLNNKTPFIYCLYKGNIYKFDRVGYSDEEMLLQIMDLEDNERRKFERLEHKFSLAEQEEKQGQRPTIPEEVRIAVWRRDEGKCVKCESRDNLEYDHIIPISKGGSNTVRNIELLCEKCNREKKDNIQ